jgi:asparagine synthase (glutamine-hydrolysing)
MCGICGTVGRADGSELHAMAMSMAHRGPDGDGVHTFPGEPPAGLGHRRLAIIDPSPAGAQPMEFGGRWWITYNGELYNFMELRRELEQLGERFQTACDTEVLLRMYVVHGPAMLARLNGIFAFAIWDDFERQLFLARDRLGVKPLYYTQAGDVFAFASEIRALLPFVASPTLDPEALADYLTLLWVPDPKTAFREVSKLPPGHFAYVDGASLRIESYWDLHFEPEDRPESEWISLVHDAVDSSVKGQMVSDVPLGSFLSGGIDSSAVVAAMTGSGSVNTYTVGFAEEDLAREIVPDDLPYARRVGALLGTNYHEEVLRPNVLELLPKAVWHLEEPVADPAAISTYLICREAGRDMKVMLSGVGGDEVFGGYPRYLAWKISRVLDHLPAVSMRAAGRILSPLARPGAAGRLRGPRRNFWKYQRAAGLPPLERYLSFSSYYDGRELSRLLAPDLRHVVNGYDPLARHLGYMQSDVGGDDFARLLYVDAKTFLPCLNLTYTDKMSMAASVEVRVPLLDDAIVDLTRRIPSSLKLHGWRRKYVFKKSQEGRLPNDVIWRRKAGFGAPIRSWLEKDRRCSGGDADDGREQFGNRRLQPSSVCAPHAGALVPNVSRPHLVIRLPDSHAVGTSARRLMTWQRSGLLPHLAGREALRPPLGRVLPPRGATGASATISRNPSRTPTLRRWLGGAAINANHGSSRYFAGRDVDLAFDQ